MLEPLTTIIFKHQVVGGRAAVEPKLEFSGAPKGYLRMSFLSRCEQLSKPQTLEPITQLSLLASYFYKKKGRFRRVISGAERAQATLHIHTQCTTLKPKAFPIMLLGGKEILDQSVLTLLGGSWQSLGGFAVSGPPALGCSLSHGH